MLEISITSTKTTNIKNSNKHTTTAKLQKELKEKDEEEMVALKKVDTDEKDKEEANAKMRIITDEKHEEIRILTESHSTNLKIFFSFINFIELPWMEILV